MIIAETERLILRHACLADGAAMDGVFGDPEVMRFGPGVQTPQWVRGWLRNCISDYERVGFGPWAIVEKRRGEVIGYCGLMRTADVDVSVGATVGASAVGYRLIRAYWGRGFASEAASAACDYGFHKLRLPRLIALIDPGNAASIRVAEKIGLNYERDVMLPEYDYPDRLYSIDAPLGANLAR